ncbi:hypothetical protein HanPSC8_Chr15g0668901 [Helianthus annuus]|nr:hypothetical protein HanPSC8_Chr15g0668901 [Helianthus annuus]
MPPPHANTNLFPCISCFSKPDILIFCSPISSFVTYPLHTSESIPAAFLTLLNSLLSLLTTCNP